MFKVAFILSTLCIPFDNFFSDLGLVLKPSMWKFDNCYLDSSDLLLPGLASIFFISTLLK